jgi:hypothetical protein
MSSTLIDTTDINHLLGELENPTILHAAILYVLTVAYQSTGKQWFGCRHDDWYDLALLSRHQYWRTIRELVEGGIVITQRGAEKQTSRPIVYQALRSIAFDPQSEANTYIYQGDF